MSAVDEAGSVQWDTLKYFLWPLVPTDTPSDTQCNTHSNTHSQQSDVLSSPEPCTDVPHLTDFTRLSYLCFPELQLLVPKSPYECWPRFLWKSRESCLREEVDMWSDEKQPAAASFLLLVIWKWCPWEGKMVRRWRHWQAVDEKEHQEGSDVKELEVMLASHGDHMTKMDRKHVKRRLKEARRKFRRDSNTSL